VKTLRVGFIGTGRKWKTPGATGFGMTYSHASGYKKLPDIELAACADIVKENAEAFAAETGTKAVYADYRLMLRKEKLDVMSIATWPHLHAPMVVDCCRAGVKAIHCEKPMATTWGDSLKMAKAAKDNGVKLTFNHQRRFGDAYIKAKEIIWGGTIGDLKRMEAFCDNLYDWGTHWLDMLNMMNRETPAEWILGQLDCRNARTVFAAPVEDHGIYQIRYANGVEGLVFTGNSKQRAESWSLRFTGTRGIMELQWSKPVIRLWTRGKPDFEDGPGPDSMDAGPSIDRAIESVIGALRGAGTSQLCVENALRATELIFAGFESSRRGGRIELPLTIKDNPLADLIKSRRDIGPKKRG
jgi:predicted dehydrogenase